MDAAPAGPVLLSPARVFARGRQGRTGARPLRIAAALFLLVASIGFAEPNDAIWSGLVLATNEAKPTAPPAELAKFAGRLRNFFGYNQFELIGSHTETIDDPSERWLVPSKSFFLCVKMKEGEGGVHLLTLKLYQEKKLLVETQAQLGSESPLFIRGPLYGEGQLLIVLSMK